MSRRRAETSASATRLQSLRAGVSTLAWGLASCAAVVLASAVLLRTLRADEGASPWREWFKAADRLTPGILADAPVPDWTWLRAEAWDSALGWALASFGWLVLGLVTSLALRGRAGRPGREVRAYTRPASETAPDQGEQTR